MSVPANTFFQPSKFVLAACLGASTLLAFSLAATPALAQGNTDKQDTRREQSGAKVTVFRENEHQDKGTSDAELVDDSYQAKGFEMGQFLLLPKVEVGERYDSNIFGTHDAVKSDFITIVRPEVKLRSRFIEHELNFTAFAEDYRLARFTDDNRTNFTTYVDGRYDFSSDTQAIQFSQLEWGHEDRTSPDAVNGVKPNTTFTSTNLTGLQHKAGRYKLVGEAGYDRKEFGDSTTSAGNTIDNSDRDRWEFQVKERAGYEMFPGYSAIVELSQNTHRYDTSSDRNGFDRNSSGYRAEAGFGVDISKLIRGDFLVGYMQQNYRDDRFKDPSGVALRAAFNWTPTKLTSVMPTLERTITDTTTARASAVVRNMGTLTVKHELARNMIATGFGSLSFDQLQGVNNQDYWTYEAGGSLIYKFNPEVYVQGEGKYRNKDAEQTVSSYSQTVLMVRLGLQY